MSGETGMRTSLLRLAVRIVGIALVIVLAGSLALRLHGRKRLAVAEGEFRRAASQFEADACRSLNVPDAENASIWLRAGANALVLSQADKALLADLASLPVARWTPEQKAALGRLADGNAPGIELLARGAGLKRSSYGLNGTESDEERKVALPLLPLINSARLLQPAARLALAEGKVDRFLELTGAIAAVAVSTEREAPLISPLIGLAAEKIMLTAVADAVADPTLDDAALARLEEILVDVDLRTAWRRSVVCGRRGVDTRVGDAAVEGDVWPGLLRVVLGASLWDAPYVEVHARLLSAFDEPYGLGRTGESVRNIRIWPLGPQMFMVPNLVNAAGRFQVVASERRLASLAIRLRRQALRSGSYPASLLGVAGGEGPDPFSGRSLSYEVRPDGSARLAVPGGEVLWDKLNPTIHFPGPFTWELPALNPSR